ncbi:heterokaryon incompatibility protein-domain-containing protein [Apodospora peruviana]|uniref:Heterokaryon incompatibility protein-domain-containing protein n=1 Tax=Apodospora peruviana TaxID=516989 RepID=A0AAE0IH10_9PEZI|nr:heterokaryon incompatibility protein-domain-containing protein [Apodospora peruviana]
MEQFSGSTTPHRKLNGDELRYVKLHPAASDSDPVICSLHYSPPLRGESYETLSYAWGSTAKTAPITLDGCEFPVTINLFDALVQLRLQEQPRLLWIDAICINQQDGEERSALVQKMRDIYQHSGKTIVWLGTPGKKHEQDAIEAAYSIAREIASLLDGSETSILKEAEFYKKNRISLLYLADICSRAWFRRVWVIQEVDRDQEQQQGDKTSLAAGISSIRISQQREIWLYCGGSSILFQTLFSACEAAALMVSTTATWTIGSCRIRAMANAYDIRRYLEEAEGYGHGTITSGHKLAMILSAAAYAKSTDPRDKIYALLGLLPPSTLAVLPKNLKPDYTKDISSIFKDYAAYIIRSAGLIDVMYFTAGGTKPKDPLSLPTWVPDWSRDGYAMSEKLAAKYCIASSAVLARGRGPQVRGADTESPRLVVNGIRTGTIKLILPRIGKDSHKREDNRGPKEKLENLSVKRKYMHVRNYLCILELIRDPHGTGHELPQQVQWAKDNWLRLLTRSPKSARDSATTSLETVSKVYDTLLTDPDPSPETLARTEFVVYHIYRRLSGRTAVVCSDGTSHLCDRYGGEPQIEDCLFVLEGSVHQYVLRPVGSCYNRDIVWQRINNTSFRPPELQAFWEAGKATNVTAHKKVTEFWERNEELVERVIIV